MLGGAGHTGEGVRLREQGRTVHMRKSGEEREKFKKKRKREREQNIAPRSRGALLVAEYSSRTER